jgi:hypothetical protein
MIVTINTIKPAHSRDEAYNRIGTGQIETGNILWISRENIKGFSFQNNHRKFSASNTGAEITVIHTNQPTRDEYRHGSNEIYATERPQNDLQDRHGPSITEALQDEGVRLLQDRIKTGFSGWKKDAYLNLDHVRLAERSWTLFSPPRTAVTLDTGEKLLIEMAPENFRDAWQPKLHHPALWATSRDKRRLL